MKYILGARRRVHRPLHARVEGSLRQPQDQLQALCAEEQDHVGWPHVGLEGQRGGPLHQVEDPHQGAALHPLLQDVPALSNRESDDYAHWIYPEQAHRILLLLQTQRRLAFVIIIFAIFHFSTEKCVLVLHFDHACLSSAIF